MKIGYLRTFGPPDISAPAAKFSQLFYRRRFMANAECTLFWRERHNRGGGLLNTVPKKRIPEHFQYNDDDGPPFTILNARIPTA